MRMRLRQVALVAADLAAAEREIEDAFGLSLCFRDPGVGHFGLENALYPIGDKLLEVVSPTQSGTTAGRLLEKRKGDGGYMVILQVEDLEPLRARFRDVGARVVHEANGPGITGLHLHPRDVGGAILSVDQIDDWDAWPWAGPAWREHVRTDSVNDIAGVEIQAADPGAMAARWGDVLGRPVVGGTRLELDEGRLDFVPVADDRGEGVSGLRLCSSTGERATLDLCGVQVVTE